MYFVEIIDQLNNFRGLSRHCYVPDMWFQASVLDKRTVMQPDMGAEVLTAASIPYSYNKDEMSTMRELGVHTYNRAE